MTRDPRQLVRRHQGGVLLDTNVLMLYLAHRVDAQALDRLDRWKRLARFVPDHLTVLAKCLSVARRFVTTPHILTEATNMSDSVPQPLRDRYWMALRTFIGDSRERWLAARTMTKDKDFERLGLADVAQLCLPRRAKPVVITVDGPLTLRLEKRGLPFVNLTHYVYPV